LQPGDRVEFAGVSAVLGEQLGEPGAQGTVFRLERPHEHLVAKILHSPSDDDEKRILALSEALRNNGLSRGWKIAAPLDTVTTDGAFAGSICEYLDMDEWPPLFGLFVDWSVDLRARLTVARSLAKKVDAIHSGHFVIGDLNPHNLLWRRKEPDVAFIDVDSWGIEPDTIDDPMVAGSAPAVTAVTAPFKRPEWLPAGTGQVSKETDNFALALLILQVFTGHHPFGSDKRDAPTASKEALIARGHAWVLEPDGYLLPKIFRHGHPGLAALPGDLPRLSREALTSARPPSAHEWSVELGKAAIGTCGHCRRPTFVGAQCGWRGNHAPLSPVVAYPAPSASIPAPLPSVPASVPVLPSAPIWSSAPVTRRAPDDPVVTAAAQAAWTRGGSTRQPLSGGRRSVPARGPRGRRVLTGVVVGLLVVVLLVAVLWLLLIGGIL
jgi:serine/threonine protein kinase